MANIVMTTHWTSGDVYPFIRLGRHLRRRGHAVTLLTHCAYEAAARAAGIEFVAIDTPAEWQRFVTEQMPRIAGTLNTLQNIASLAQDYNTEDDFQARFAIMRRELELVRERCTAPETILVGRHTSSLPAMLAAEELGLPMVSVFMAPSQVAQSVLDEAMVGEVMVSDINRTRAGLGFAPIRGWSAWVNAAPRHLGLWPDWFAPAEPGWPAEVMPVGFPIDREAAEVGELPPELRALGTPLGGERPILISGGSGKIIRAEFYQVAVAACGLLGRPTLVVTEHREFLPATLPANVRWYPFLPFARLMPQVAAVVHHGGIGSITQALIAGAPQLALAHGLDRPDNGARIKHLGGGDMLPLAKWQPETIAASLRELTQPAVYARCQELAARLEEGAGLDRAADAIEGAAGLRLDPAAFLRDNASQPAADRQARAVAESQANPASDRLSQLTPDQLALLVRRMKQKKAQI